MFDKYGATFAVALVAVIVGDMLRDAGPVGADGKIALGSDGKPMRAPWKMTVPFLNMQVPTIAGGAGGIF